MSDRYVLDQDGNPKPEPDLMTWAKWLEKNPNRILQQDFIGDVKVSTVFLGLDHSFGRKGPPILWETMIFGGEHDQFQERYASREAAMKGHQAALDLVKSEELKTNVQP